MLHNVFKLYLISPIESQKGINNNQRCSIENQKGINDNQRCSIENQKGAITIDFVQW